MKKLLELIRFYEKVELTRINENFNGTHTFCEKVVGTHTFLLKRYCKSYISMKRLSDLIQFYEKVIGTHTFL